MVFLLLQRPLTRATALPSRAAGYPGSAIALSAVDAIPD
jgi:hypothetical protein